MFNILPAFQTPVITHTFHSKATSSLLNMLIIHEHCLPWPCPNSDPNTPPAVSLICQAPCPLQELPPPHHVKLIYHVLRYLLETQTWSCDSSDHKPLMISCCRRTDTSCLSSETCIHTTSPWASFLTPSLQAVTWGIPHIPSVQQAQKCSYTLVISILPSSIF